MKEDKKKNIITQTPVEKSGGFFANLFKSFGGKSGKDKELLFEHQRILQKEKELKAGTGVKPTTLSQEERTAALNDSALKKEAPAKKISSPKPTASVRNAKNFFRSFVTRGSVPSTIETNLIKNEVSEFFNWRPNIIFLITNIVLTLVAMGTYFGYVAYVEFQQIALENDLDIQIKENNRFIMIAKANANEVISFNNNVDTIKGILSKHIYWTNLFNFLEESLLDVVFLENFSGNTTGEYSLPIVAGHYFEVTRQAKVFLEDNSGFVKDLSVASVSGIGSIKTQINIQIDKNIFYKN